MPTVPASRLLPRYGCALVLAAIAACGPGAHPAGECTGVDVELRSEGILTVGADLSTPPFAFLDERDETTGFEVELLRAAAREMSLDARFVDQSRPGLVPGLLAGHFDVVAGGVASGQEGASETCPAPGHLTADLAVVHNPARTPELSGAGDVDGAAGVVDGSPAEAWVREHLSGSDIRPSPTSDDVFNSLRDGAVQVVVTDAPSAWWRAKDDRDFEVVEQIGRGEEYVFLSRPDNAGLRDALADALGRLHSDGTYGELHERWFGRGPGA